MPSPLSAEQKLELAGDLFADAPAAPAADAATVTPPAVEIGAVPEWARVQVDPDLTAARDLFKPLAQRRKEETAARKTAEQAPKSPSQEKPSSSLGDFYRGQTREQLEARQAAIEADLRRRDLEEFAQLSPQERDDFAEGNDTAIDDLSDITEEQAAQVLRDAGWTIA